MLFHGGATVTISDGITLALLLVGCAFFITGSLGLLRLPDVYTRLHALTKADNLGLGFIVAGLAVYGGSWVLALKLALIWILVMLSSAVASQLIAEHMSQRGIAHWTKP